MNPKDQSLCWAPGEEGGGCVAVRSPNPSSFPSERRGRPEFWGRADWNAVGRGCHRVGRGEEGQLQGKMCVLCLFGGFR